MTFEYVSDDGETIFNFDDFLRALWKCVICAFA